MHADFRRSHPRESACIGGFISIYRFVNFEATKWSQH